jgi:hypothetical protein
LERICRGMMMRMIFLSFCDKNGLILDRNIIWTTPILVSMLSQLSPYQMRSSTKTVNLQHPSRGNQGDNENAQ